MQNNLFSLLIYSDFLLLMGIIVVLLLGLFIRKNNFSIISNSSILLLFFISFFVFFDNEFSLFYFQNFFINSEFITFFKLLVIFGSGLTIIISSNYYKNLKIIKFEIPILILFATLGMLILIGSNSLMSMYLGIELQSLSLYVLTAINRDSLKSSESGIKYFVLGALSSGILLYGCSLIYGFTGTTNFDQIAVNLTNNDLNIGLIFGLVFILVGLAFKISAVPFHMWTPDVYEGAPTSVTAFFAIVPKVAGIALIYRFCLEPFGNFSKEWSQIIIFLSISSMYLGSIAAIMQTNIKRLLAYSSIGHIGFILIGLASSNSYGIKGAIIYIFLYVVMNTAIFSILLSLKLNDKYIENINDLSGLSKSKPFFSASIAVIMLSMAGIPPLAGFFGKFYIFISALEADLIYLAVLGVIASVISAFYYLKIIKIMYFDNLDSSNFRVNISRGSSIVLIISIGLISLFVFYPSLLIMIANDISINFFN